MTLGCPALMPTTSPEVPPRAPTRRPLRLPLRVFLFVALSTATLAPIAYLGPRQVARWREVQREAADNELHLAAESLARAIGQTIDSSVRELTAMANQIGIDGTLDPARLQPTLEQFQRTFPACLGVNVSGLDARPIVSAPGRSGRVHFADRAYYQRMLATGRTSVSGVELGRSTGVPTIHICAPIWSETSGQRTLIGSTISALGLSYLQHVTTKSVELFGDMQARVLDKRGRVVVDSDPSGKPPMAELAGIAMYQDVSAGPAQLRDGRDDRGIAVRVALARVPEQDLGWTVAVMRPAWKIEGEASRARTSTLIAVLGALGLGVVFAYLLSIWLAHPISRLARYTLRVASGETVAPPRPESMDAREVTDLVETVSAMVAKLQSQADVIREREKEKMVLARFKRELEIAERIQTGILPKCFDVPGFEVAALMRTAEAVGGDYYEFLPTATGFWIASGDVSGHGLIAGLVMLMLQSALAAIAVHTPSAGPAEILRSANQLLVENIRSRLSGDDHVTLVLMHVSNDGTFVYSGGHEPLLILRKSAGSCEVHEIDGPWLGITAEVGRSFRESTGHLDPGDLLVFHSDGIVEAGASRREAYGLERLSASVERLRNQPATVLCSETLREARAWAKREQEDDMTIVVVRRREPGQVV
jgi:serine phosphatase RsbU (regulator of sigma subunit)